MVETMANIQTGVRDFPKEKYELFRDIPVFVEHETLSRPDKDGKRRALKFTRRELALIADKCNQRIEETGDYAAVTLGHTPEKVERPSDMPPVVGFGGPFHVGKLPNGKAAVLADFHIRKQDAEMLDRYPRRSPELWLADDYADMFFDPISLIGAEAPRLDMGMMFYSRRRGGQTVETYSAVFPSGSNTFVPSEDVLDKKGRRYAAGEPGAEGGQDQATGATEMALSPEDVGQIVSAIEQTDWAQWCKAKMAAEATAGSEKPGEEEVAATKFAAGEDEKKEEKVEAEPEKDKAPEQYAKLRDEVRLLKSTLGETKEKLDGAVSRLDEERSKRVNAERYSKLQDLRYRYSFDLEKQVERCKYGKMSDAQFQDHLDMVAENFQRIPVDEMLPVPAGSERGANGRPGAVAEREKYSKEHSDEAMRRCEAKVAKGEKADYEEILAEVKASK